MSSRQAVGARLLSGTSLLPASRVIAPRGIAPRMSGVPASSWPSRRGRRFRIGGVARGALGGDVSRLWVSSSPRGCSASDTNAGRRSFKETSKPRSTACTKLSRQLVLTSGTALLGVRLQGASQSRMRPAFGCLEEASAKSSLTKSFPGPAKDDFKATESRPGEHAPEPR